MHTTYSYVPQKTHQSNPVEFENSLFNAIDDGRPRYNQAFYHPVKPTSSELSLTNSVIAAECDNTTSKPEKQRSCTDVERDGAEMMHFCTEVPRCSSTSQNHFSRNTEPPISLPGINTLDTTVSKPLLEDEL